MLSNEATVDLSLEQEQILLDVAKASIEAGLSRGGKLVVRSEDYLGPLQMRRASFVTLRIAGELRGCMGSLVVKEPLVADVASNAFLAAFCDPRFSPLKHHEFGRLEVHLSLLSSAEPMAADSESDLLRKIRPGIDGLIVYEGKRRGTLLPSVWESVSDPLIFLEHLKRKAGLPVDYWSETIRFERYTTTSIPRRL